MNALHLTLPLSSPLDSVPAALGPMLESCPGETPVHLEASAPGWGPFALELGRRFRVSVTPALVVALVGLLGCENVKPPALHGSRPGDSVEITPVPARIPPRLDRNGRWMVLDTLENFRRADALAVLRSMPGASPVCARVAPGRRLEVLPVWTDPLEGMLDTLRPLGVTDAFMVSDDKIRQEYNLEVDWSTVPTVTAAAPVPAMPARPAVAAFTPSVAVVAPAPALDPERPHNAPQRRFPKVPADVEAFASAMRSKPGMVLEAIHEYTHADGSPWWWVARWKNRATGDKRMSQFHRTPAGDFVGEMPKRPTGNPLYRGHRLSQNPSALVYLVEGELCVDCLESVGILAVTWPVGAQSFGKVDWSTLAGRGVVLWPDNDAPGLEAMQSIRDTLERLGAVVLVVDVVALAMPPKGDVVDWLRRWLEQHGARRVSDLPGGRDLVAEALDELPYIDEMGAAA